MIPWNVGKPSLSFQPNAIPFSWEWREYLISSFKPYTLKLAFLVYQTSPGIVSTHATCGGSKSQFQLIKCGIKITQFKWDKLPLSNHPSDLRMFELNICVKRSGNLCILSLGMSCAPLQLSTSLELWPYKYYQTIKTILYPLFS